MATKLELVEGMVHWMWGRSGPNVNHRIIQQWILPLDSIIPFDLMVFPSPNSQSAFIVHFSDKPPPAPQFQAHFFQSSSLVDSSSISAPNDSPCHLPLQKGNCRQAILRYFYQSDSNQCRPFYFTGCGGNGNNFGTMNECKLTCKSEGKCHYFGNKCE